MKQYIDKAAVVTEIKKEIKDIYAGREYVGIPSWEEREIDGLEKAIKILNTLEVKEVRDIWHDVSEKPELEQPLLIIMKGTHKDFRKHYRIGCYGKRANDIPTWVINGCYSDSFISKWCYISDILKQTIEVKEVDLEKEINLWIEDNTCRGYCSASIHDTAEYFFELGIKTKKENKLWSNIYQNLL